jgi:membrane protein implicated in regulation of membrane protease activity
LKLNWDLPSVPASRRPVRDGLIVYGVLAIVIVVLGTLTGGDWARALVAAAAFFVAATAWTWLRVRRRQEPRR